jgi:hypothetical protein
MGIAVSFRAVVDELDALQDECTAYLNRQTGELLTLGDEELRAVDDDVDPADLPEWQRDDLPRLREVLDSGDWLALPTSFDIHEWAFMDDFARSLDDAAVRDELLDAIRGAGAFRNFKGAVRRHGIQDTWHNFRFAALGRVATDWLDEHGIAYIRDDAAPAKG